MPFIKIPNTGPEQACRSDHKSSVLNLVSLRDLLDIQVEVLGDLV